jgi:soluble lytic murein transglycosylase-like protein
VSDLESIAVAKPSARAFTRTLILGGLCATAALMMQSANFNARHDAVARRPILARFISNPAPVQNSAYDEESTMSSAQLLGRWDALITEASQRYHVPKPWIRAVMAHESGGRTMLGEDRPIVSRAGAVGLMQVLPATYIEMAGQHRLGGNPFDARDNIMAGTAYLHWLHQRYGFPAMFAAYNAGPGRLEDHLKQGSNLPAETRAYIGGIARTLKLQPVKSGPDLVKFTRPDGATVKIDPGQVTAIRAALPGEFDWSVKSVLTLGKHAQQGIREDLQVATAAIRSSGKSI